MISRFVYVVLPGMLISGCAQMAIPTGGDKDVDAPVIIENGAVPKSGTVNFSSTRVYIEFNEYIKIQPGKQPLVSPPISSPPQLSVKGKRLVIDLPTDLQPNTTYTLHFPGTIADITENNPVDNFSYVFSTGPFIDSGIVTGRVMNATTHGAFAKAWVLLYADTVALPLTRALPSGITRTNAAGEYRLENIKKGKYFLRALTDVNNNLRYDLPGEWLGFCDSLIEVDTVCNAPVLYMFKQREKKLRIVSDVSVSATVHRLVFNKPLPKAELRPINRSENFRNAVTERGDTVMITSFKQPLADTAWLQVWAENKMMDTIFILPEKNKKFTLSVTVPLVTGLLPDQHIEFQCNDWCAWDTSKVTVYDTLHKKRLTDITFINGVKPALSFAHSSEPVYKITLLKGALTNHESKSNDSLGGYFRWLEPEKYGTLLLTYDFSVFARNKEKLVFDLFRISPLSSDTVHVQTNTGNIQFNAIRPGNYVLRAFIDANGDGRWTPGNYETKLQPEFSFVLPQPVQIRANWEMELNWKPE